MNTLTHTHKHTHTHTHTLKHTHTHTHTHLYVLFKLVYISRLAKEIHTLTKKNVLHTPT